MTLIRTKTGFRVPGRLELLGEKDGVLTAWAERHVTVDPNFRWLLGNFVEADRANQNGHIFVLDELRAAVPTLHLKALNVLHREQHCIGAFASGQLVKPDGTELKADEVTDDDQLEAAEAFPIMESLAAMWVRRFPDEFLAIRGAHAEGSLWYSHETTPSEVSCPVCEHRTAFAGINDESYCEHMNASMVAPMRLHEPVFAGGAVVIPPARPGWNRADMKKISALLKAEPEAAEELYASLEEDLPALEAKTWEHMMEQILLDAAGQ